MIEANKTVSDTINRLIQARLGLRIKNNKQLEEATNIVLSLPYSLRTYYITHGQL